MTAPAAEEDSPHKGALSSAKATGPSSPAATTPATPWLTGLYLCGHVTQRWKRPIEDPPGERVTYEIATARGVWHVEEQRAADEAGPYREIGDYVDDPIAVEIVNTAGGARLRWRFVRVV